MLCPKKFSNPFLAEKVHKKQMKKSDAFACEKDNCAWNLRNNLNPKCAMTEIADSDSIKRHF